MDKSEAVMSEFDYMEESFDEFRSDFPFSFSHEDLNENDHASFNDPTVNMNKLKIDELENFFTDLSQINQFVLTYGNKLLFKYKKSFANKSSSDSSSSEDSMTAQHLNFSIDSSSLFMLLLEAANFLEYSATNPFKDEDIFKSASLSPMEHSAIESESQENNNINEMVITNSDTKLAELSSYVDNFQSVRTTPVTPSRSLTYRTPPTNFSNKDFSPTSSSIKNKSSLINNINKFKV